MMKNEIIKMLRGCLIVLASSIVGMLLIMLSYMIPVENIKLNAERGSEVMLSQGEWYLYAGEYTASVLDNYTDAQILGEVTYRSNSIINSAVNVPILQFPGDGGAFYSLYSYFHNDSDGGEVNYSRYWHGWVVLLKPFFFFLDFADFRILNQIVQLCLIFGVICLFMKRKLERYLLAFIPMIAFWNPATIGVSLQYAPCFYISIIGTILVFLIDKKDKVWKLFLFMGILTAYFDFLTYPLVTLAVPLVTYFIVNSDGLIQSKKAIIDLVEKCIFWGIGYAGMWVMKWVIGSILLQKNIFIDAINQAKVRAGVVIESEEISRLGAITSVVRKSLFHWPYLIMLISVFVVIIVLYRKARLDFHRISRVIVFMIIALMPFIWYFVMSDHSYVHPRLVYRCLGISIYAGFTAMIMFLSDGMPDKVIEKTNEKSNGTI